MSKIVTDSYAVAILASIDGLYIDTQHLYSVEGQTVHHLIQDDLTR
jgi:hypothetical protein